MRAPLGDLLDRFRRTAGVPAAAADDLRSELAPVFAALEEIDAAAAAVGARAAARARERLAQAHEQASSVEAGWHARADEARAHAGAERRRLAEEEARAIVAAAEREAARVRARGHERIGRLAGEVAACVREWSP
ncbi:MAG TPA: hypothetical protein VMG74_01305 [Gaiellaceae bacterium]|nr:hypothetical protein [Gaiellaceae bacterium]